jgi:hypothetical protein
MNSALPLLLLAGAITILVLILVATMLPQVRIAPRLARRQQVERVEDGARRTDQQAGDEAAYAARIARRLADLAPAGTLSLAGEMGLVSRAPAGEATRAGTPAPGRVGGGPGRADAGEPTRGWRPGRLADATGVGIVVLLAAAALMPRVAPGGVLGVQGVPATGGGAATPSAGPVLPAAVPAPDVPGNTRPGPGSSAGAAATPPVTGTHTANATAPARGSGRGPAAGTAAPRATPSACGTAGCLVYVVRPGDTLLRIAARFRVSVAVIMAANPGLTDPNLIVSGQALRIPRVS